MTAFFLVNRHNKLEFSLLMYIPSVSFPLPTPAKVRTCKLIISRHCHHINRFSLAYLLGSCQHMMSLDTCFNKNSPNICVDEQEVMRWALNMCRNDISRQQMLWNVRWLCKKTTIECYAQYPKCHEHSRAHEIFSHFRRTGMCVLTGSLPMALFALPFNNKLAKALCRTNWSAFGLKTIQETEQCARGEWEKAVRPHHETLFRNSISEMNSPLMQHTHMPLAVALILLASCARMPVHVIW